jgi:hypothetical protein
MSQENFSMSNTAPAKGEVWVHYKGGKYVVAGLAIRESDRTDEETKYAVVYSDAHRTAYTRNVEDWSDMVEHEGKLVPRFTKAIGEKHDVVFYGDQPEGFIPILALRKSGVVADEKKYDVVYMDHNRTLFSIHQEDYKSKEEFPRFTWII